MLMNTANKERTGFLTKKRHSDHTTINDMTTSTTARPFITQGRNKHFQYHSAEKNILQYAHYYSREVNKTVLVNRKYFLRTSIPITFKWKYAAGAKMFLT